MYDLSRLIMNFTAGFSNKSRCIIRFYIYRFITFWYFIFLLRLNQFKSSIICFFSGGIQSLCLLVVSSSFSLLFCYTYWSYFIRYFISNQISCSFCCWTTLLEAVFAAFIPVFVVLSIKFLQYLSPNFLVNDKKP